MSSSFQYPFAFSFQDELNFATFLVTAENAALVDFMQHFAAGTEQFCYLWGDSGAGKTHLLQALSHTSETAVYLPLQLLQEYGPASLDGLEAFSFLVLDDVQLIAGKRDWEEKLFYLFNALHSKQGKLCLAANVNPASLSLVLADLKSRLQLAVIFEVKELHEAGKQQALVQQAAQRGIELKPEVASYIMSRNPRSMHELTAVLKQLDTLSLAEKRRITIPFVKDICHW